MYVAVPEQAGDAPAPAEPEGLSAFVARVLNQLSLSAWLPGAFFIVTSACIWWFRTRGAVTLSGLGAYVQANWVPVLVLALPSLVVATLLTQAFSFEAIRSLEGYWRTRGPESLMRNIGITWQAYRQQSLEKRLRRMVAKAFRKARPRLLAHGIDAAALLAVQADFDGDPRPTGFTKKQTKNAAALHISWLTDCDPRAAATIQRVQRDLAEFPQYSRVMPTRLGNVLRTAEDRLRNLNGDLEGFVMAHRAVVPTRVLEHHDQFRTRLDMYCTLVFVAVAVAVLSVLAMWTLPMIGRILIPLVLLIMAWVSYRAAVSSARGYATILGQIDDSIDRSNARPK